jgi:hypothetical protein
MTDSEEYKKHLSGVFTRASVFYDALMAVGDRGEVIGIDLSDGMIQEINMAPSLLEREEAL